MGAQTARERQLHQIRILDEVYDEVARIRELFGDQSDLPAGTDNLIWREVADLARERCQNAAAEGSLTFQMILEEEVAEAFAEPEPVKLREELLQVAAVCVQWVHAIDLRAEPRDGAQSTGASAP